ncbi:MAG: hypothetical protein BWX54_01426 [Verrucomicrobia bacterium ADurb.Bin018]|nr:MAG: hypothetical protein BWX54_01426 [Verrucomicrobia bacterium ADurb.Bin018]
MEEGGADKKDQCGGRGEERFPSHSQQWAGRVQARINAGGRVSEGSGHGGGDFRRSDGAGNVAQLVAQLPGMGRVGQRGGEVGLLTRRKFTRLFEQEQLFELSGFHGAESCSSR